MAILPPPISQLPNNTVLQRTYLMLWETAMRIFALLMTSVMILGAQLAPTPAAAFGDRCYASVAERGKAHSMRDAMREARHNWKHEVAHRHGARAADWDYSGDRRYDCSWDAPARHFTCVASASPCERR
jgi:hypothetical protein